MSLKHVKVGLIGCFLLCFQLAWAQPSEEAGKTLFRNYCASCHAKDMKTLSTGPALAGLEERWADYPREDLYGWIRNSQAMINAGHPRAVELWNEYKSIMTAWPNLTDEDIESIILHINAVATAVPVVADNGGGGTGGSGDSGGNYSWLYWILFAALGAVSYTHLTLPTKA